MNPMLQMLNKSNGLNNALNLARSFIGNGSPDQAMNTLMQTNPKFREFVRANQGKTPEQIAAEYGIDPAILKSLMSGRT